MVGFDDAFALSQSLLAEALPDRWRHVQSVADQAARVGVHPDIDAEALRVAAILHDIGYSPAVAHLRFHPLDGARFLSAAGYPELRGIDGVDKYADEASPTRDALWYCDATTGPQGQRLIADDRWAEIRFRYGSDNIVTTFLDRAEPQLRGAVDRTLARLAEAGVSA